MNFHTCWLYTAPTIVVAIVHQYPHAVAASNCASAGNLLRTPSSNTSRCSCMKQHRVELGYLSCMLLLLLSCLFAHLACTRPLGLVVLGYCAVTYFTSKHDGLGIVMLLLLVVSRSSADSQLHHVVSSHRYNSAGTLHT